MARLCPPDGACKSMQIEGARTGSTSTYNMRKDGTLHVENPKHVKALKEMGCFEPTVRVGGTGYRCPECGFLAVFPKNCGRCGHTDLVKED